MHPSSKKQGIPKHIEAATHEIPWYMCIYAVPCLFVFCVIFGRPNLPTVMSPGPHIRHAHKNSYVDI